MADEAPPPVLSDETVALQGIQLQSSIQPSRPRGFWRTLWNVISFPWRNKWARYISLLCVLAGAASLTFIPTARYYVLNAYGITVSSSVTITDDITHQPLKDVSVYVAQASGKTDAEGRVVLQGLSLGPADVTIRRSGFTTETRRFTLGWGSNPLGMISLKASGIRYTFVLKDYLTGKGIADAKVTSAESSAISGKDGKAVLVLPNRNEAEISADIARDGYRSETVKSKPAEGATQVSLVSNRRVIYVSKEHGTYDVYAIDTDGKNKQLLLAGSGLETSNISLAVSPDGTQAAMVSTRDNQRDGTGALLNALTLIDTRTGDVVSISHAAQIRLLDWAGTRLVFEQSASEANGAAIYTVYSYDYTTSSRLQLAQASRFGSVLTARGFLYYGVSAEQTNTAASAGLYSIGFDGKGKQTVLERDVWAAYRTGYDTLSVQTSDTWYTSTIGGRNNISGPPATFVSRIYVENPVRQLESLWADVQDGQGVLFVHNRQSGKDMAVYKKQGLVGPLRWLTEDTVIFRVITSNETAEYAVSTLGGGEAHKVADVVNSYGFTAGL